MRISIWSGLCLVMVFAACQNDSKDTNYEELILGRWEIKEAQRNGRPTETLTGAFMEFLPKGRMISNVGGAPEESDYSVEGNVITSHSKRLPADFSIQYAGDSSLVLKFVMREIPFQFSLVRARTLPAEQ
ncbi:MAG: hypothetical protein IPL49_05220 [Saprospirales bacterium]|nr:hypothetical protein [Saprospirales bacterium]